MAAYVAKRIRFRNGERLSVLTVANGLPVHEVTLYLDSFRRRGRAANTIHFACCTLALLYRALDRAEIDLMGRLSSGSFLTGPELTRIASLTQLQMTDADEHCKHEGKSRATAINVARIPLRLNPKQAQLVPVDVGTQASRIRYMADFLGFITGYVAPSLSPERRTRLEKDSAQALSAFRAQIPAVSRRAKLNARIGLTHKEQELLLTAVHPESSLNPWARGFVRRRNWLIVLLLLATGMRKGELLGLQVGDINPSEPKLRIIRRADAIEDARRVQPNTKTRDREIEVSPAIMRTLWEHINVDRRSIPAARKIPQVFVSDEGKALSGSSIDKAFRQLRSACPALSTRLTSHVMRHTWNERFSEQADAMGLTDVEEQQARNQQQGWSDNSASAATYTRRHTAKKGNEISLLLQERLDEQLQKND